MIQKAHCASRVFSAILQCKKLSNKKAKMKKNIICICVIMLFTSGVLPLQAQLFKKLGDKVKNAVDKKVEQKKAETKNKVDNTIDQKVENTETKIENAAKDAITKKDKTDAEEVTVEPKKTNSKNISPQKPNTNKTVNQTLSEIEVAGFNSNESFTPKMSFTPFKDPLGNFYGIENANRGTIIYKKTPSGETTIYVDFKANKLIKNADFKNKWVMDNEGNIIFGMGVNNGFIIYKLTTNGKIIPFAGQERNKTTIADGKGNNAKIGRSASHFRLGRDGQIYFIDMLLYTSPGNQKSVIENYSGPLDYDGKVDKSIIRKISADGEISTLKDEQGTIIVSKSVILDYQINSKGEIYFSSADHNVHGCISKITTENKLIHLIGTTGENYDMMSKVNVKTPKWRMGVTNQAILGGANKFLLNDKEELIIWGAWAKRFCKYDGKTITAFSCTSDMKRYEENTAGGASSKYVDGKATVAQVPFIDDFFYREGFVYFIAQSRQYDDMYFAVRKIAADGTISTVERIKE
jgi:hypothetical protein